jgi:putative iron-regulated protein
MKKLTIRSSIFPIERLLSPLLLGLVLSCGSDPEASGGLPANTADGIQTYAAVALSSYQDSLSTAEELDQSITDFLAAPTEEGFEAAKEAWLFAREPYLQTEVFRFYDGPIDNPDDGPEGLLNAWPLDEFYIDYVEDEFNALYWCNQYHSNYCGESDFDR